MSSSRYVSYIRLGLPGQGPPELALASQRRAVAAHLGRVGQCVAEVTESEPSADRPALREALALCRRHDATLLVAELGALSTDAAFLTELRHDLRQHDLRFVAADMPGANELTLGLMAAVAEAEAKFGTPRDAAALARRREFYARFTAERRARARQAEVAGDAAGLVRPLAESRGRGAASPKSREMARDVAPLLTEIRAAGAVTLEQVANALNALGIPSARGSRWYPMQVTRIEKRLAAG